MKRLHKLLFLGIFSVVIGACQPQVAGVAPTFAPFPTMTAGQHLLGEMPTLAVNSPNLSNPATAVALANRPTPTPNLLACPITDGNAPFPNNRPRTIDEATQAIVRFLQEGGTLSDLRRNLQTGWFALGEGGALRDDIDLTGEGTPEIVLSYSASNNVGMVLVIGCADGLYRVLYQVQSDRAQPPQLLWTGDMNNAMPAELMITSVTCLASDCQNESVVLSWDGALSRLVNVLDAPLLTDNLPTVRDVDGDGVAEIVVELTNRGTSATGPLRTGVLIYDWNGRVYTLSILQYDPPRYLVQVIHEADKTFSQLNFDQAGETYALALESADLRLWFNDERPLLSSYALYRLMLIYTYLGDSRLPDVLTRLNLDYPITAEVTADSLPVYALMAYRFAESYQVNGDLHQACLDTLAIADERPQALTALNRYGSRSPTYARLDLCPF